MSTPGPSGGGFNPFEGVFGELARLLGNSSGPLNWDVARQVATVIASENQAEPNVDPLERIRLEELVRVAEMHINQATDISTNISQFEVVSHAQWANQTLDDYQAPLVALATALSQADESNAEPDINAALGANPLANIEKWMSPVLLGMQAGGMVGHMARRSLGSFDLPVPRPQFNGLRLVPDNIAQFASEWSLPVDELSLYVATEELTRNALMAIPHINQRFSDLIGEYVTGFISAASSIEDRFGHLDLSDPTNLPAALSDPEALLGAMQSPQQAQTLVHLSGLTAAFVGYVDHVTAKIASRTIASGPAIAEANKRRRVEDSDGAALVAKLFGLEMSQTQYDRGNDFINGVLERCKGDEAVVGRMWHNQGELPTPAEVDAPGLWLARVGIDF